MNGPHGGDAIRLTADWMGMPAGSVGVLDGYTDQEPEAGSITFRASVFRGRHRPPYDGTEGALVSCSGGPATISTPTDQLVATGDRHTLSCWRWNRWGVGGGNGEPFNVVVPVWEWTPQPAPLPPIPTPGYDNNLLGQYFAAQDAEATAHSKRVPWAEWEKRYTWTHSGETGPGCQLYRGFSTISGPSLREPLEFREMEGWADGGFRLVWTSGELRMILTYCEGDLTVVKCADREAYKAEILRCGEFYKHLVEP